MAKQHRMATITLAAIMAAIASIVAPTENYVVMVLGIALGVVAVGALVTSVRRTWRMVKITLKN